MDSKTTYQRAASQLSDFQRRIDTLSHSFARDPSITYNPTPSFNSDTRPNMTDHRDFAQDPQHEGNTSTTVGQDQDQDKDQSQTQVHEHATANGQNQQQIRESSAMWAEYDVNALPQVAVGDAPETVVPAIDIEADIQPPSISADKPIIVPAKPWYKSWKLWVPVALLGVLTAIIVPTVVLTRPNQGASGPSTITLPATTASYAVTDYPSASATTSTPTASSSPVSVCCWISPWRKPPVDTNETRLQIPECDSSDFVPGVNWLGSNPTGWSFDLGFANDAADCCRQCYEDSESHCNGWLYMPNDKNGVPPCNRIIDFQGPNADDSCPNGKPDIVFTRGSGTSVEGNFGGRGPCTGRVRG